MNYYFLILFFTEVFAGELASLFLFFLFCYHGATLVQSLSLLTFLVPIGKLSKVEHLNAPRAPRPLARHFQTRRRCNS